MAEVVPGARLGPYEITEKIGAGGMGEVYRATDTRLKRQVAMKVLPSALIADSERLARFQREAEVLASLNHPNIAGLHGLEESGGVKALVMELVEGPTLEDRIAEGAIPIAEALPIARQIAEALAAAHEQNVIHRDLKPANVKLRPDGTVKVLDFGLAKALDQGSGIGDQGSGKTVLANSPTMTSPAMTMHGVILGTAAYMSPEQAAGKPVDRRTDLWAFGVVLFEMLTGRHLFHGESVSHVIAAVLKDDVDWAALPANTPAHIRKLLRRCLERDRRKRLSDAATAALECEDVAPVADSPAPSHPASSARLLWWSVGLLVGVLATALVALMAWPSVPAPTAGTRFVIELPPNQLFSRTGRHVLALSSDATRLVYVANQQLYLRALSELTAVPIDGTANTDPSTPVFSPDGQWIAFWSAGTVRKIPATGGDAVVLAELSNPFGMSWQGERILGATDNPPAIVEVPANGGQAKPIVALDATKRELAQSPQSIENGRALLFTLRSNEDSWDNASIVIQDLASGARQTLVERGTDGRLLADGRLVYSRAGTLFVATLATGGRAVDGTPLPIQQRILQSVGGFSGASQVAFSDNGTLAYLPDDAWGGDRSLLWMTRQGVIETANLPSRPHFPSTSALALSPDGKLAAIRMLGTSSARTDIWIADLERKVYTRLTSSGSATDPVWTSDGSRVCYENLDAVLCQPPDGSSQATTSFTRPGLSTVAAISPDGASIVLNVTDERLGFDLWLAANKPPYEAKPLIASRGNDDSGVISPDGKWIAYASEESGTDEVYVRPFPTVDAGRWQVSTSGGVAPRWSRDGRELYYLATRTAGSSVALTLTAARVQRGTTFATAPPEVVAELPLGTRGYDSAPDGRFLISAPFTSTAPASGLQRQSLVVVQNWSALLINKRPDIAPQ